MTDDEIVRAAARYGWERAYPGETVVLAWFWSYAGRGIRPESRLFCRACLEGHWSDAPRCRLHTTIWNTPV